MGFFYTLIIVGLALLVFCCMTRAGEIPPHIKAAYTQLTGEKRPNFTIPMRIVDLDEKTREAKFRSTDGVRFKVLVPAIFEKKLGKVRKCTFANLPDGAILVIKSEEKE